jgi:hypothetical protein
MPVREAIRRLEEAGLAERVPRRPVASLVHRVRAGCALGVPSWARCLTYEVAIHDCRASCPVGVKGGSLEQRGDETPAAEGILGESMLETPQPVVGSAEDR